MTTNRRFSPAAVLVALAAMLLPVAYALSVGPANWLYDHGYLSSSMWIIYVPLDYLYQHYTPIKDALECDSSGLSDTSGSQIMVPTGGPKDEQVRVGIAAQAA
jgi:hypothetical protein